VWVTLGANPILAKCFGLLYVQLAGSELPGDLSEEQMEEQVKQAFEKQSVLLVLDDCWDLEIVPKFHKIDPSTHSKVLISSRIGTVLAGGKVITLTFPTEDDAAQMLMCAADAVKKSEACMDAATAVVSNPAMAREHVQPEVFKIVKMCKRLPLTIGIAGKMIRQLSFSGEVDWSGISEFLKEELTADDLATVEEQVIAASVKRIPSKIQKQVLKLFLSFAMIPEDTHVPLDVLGMLYDAQADDSKPISRLHVRKYLKVLIDRSLVLGTVDRPQLHDIVWEYVKKELSAGDAHKLAQRNFIESYRACRPQPLTSPISQYMQMEVVHHMQGAYDQGWATSVQAKSWLDDHVKGTQDFVAFTAATILPAETLAQEAEDCEQWWNAGLRWSAVGAFLDNDSGNKAAGKERRMQAVRLLEKAVPTITTFGSPLGSTGSSTFSQFDRDTLLISGIITIIYAWDINDIQEFMPKLMPLLKTPAAKASVVQAYKGVMMSELYPACSQGDPVALGAVTLKMTLMVQAALESDVISDEMKDLLSPCMNGWIAFHHDFWRMQPGWSIESLLGTTPSKLLQWSNSYRFDIHHSFKGDMTAGLDGFIEECAPLLLHFGDFSNSAKVINKAPEMWARVHQLQDPNYGTGYPMGMCMTLPYYHYMGMTQVSQQIFEAAGVTLSNMKEKLVPLFESSPVYKKMGVTEDVGDGGFFSSDRMLWYGAHFYIFTDLCSRMHFSVRLLASCPPPHPSLSDS
jgi:hypothetical protein